MKHRGYQIRVEWIHPRCGGGGRVGRDGGKGSRDNILSSLLSDTELLIGNRKILRMFSVSS